MAWLLVTTSKSVLLVDGKVGHGYRIDGGRGLYYGIAQSEDFLYVAARNRLVSSSIERADERGEILVFSKCLAYLESLRPPPFPLRDIHQILHAHGKIWVTCSFDNMVAIYDGANWEQWYPLGAPEGDHKDINHFNSLTLNDGGGELYVVAHNMGASDILTFDAKTKELVCSRHLGLQAHNAWVMGEELMTCSSGEGRVLGDAGTSIEIGGFPRGVATWGGEIYVGVSEIAERVERDFTTSQIKVYDFSWNYSRSIQLVDEGLVLDISAFPVSESEQLNLGALPSVDFKIL